MKSLLKRCLPPVLLDLARRGKSPGRAPIRFSGDYPGWDAAAAAAAGYDAPDILARTRAAMLEVRDGRAVFERDSVLLPEAELPFPILAALLRVAVENGGQLSVLDFGGSLGSTYFQCRRFLAPARVRWHVVEQAGHVACGQSEFADDALSFFPDIETSVLAGRSHALLLSSVLQYLPDPHEFVAGAIAHAFDYILVDRTAFYRPDRDRLTVQQVPEWIYPASYPAWFLSESRLLAQFAPAYELVASFPALDHPVLEDNGGYSKGFIFRRK